ncbi:MAG: MBL fold metallo-hydrolase [Archangium sp.]
MSLRGTWLISLVALLISTTGCETPKRRVRPDSKATRANVGLPPSNAPPPKRMWMHVIDVGQGSATLFEFPCAAILIDTGGESSSNFESNKALMAYLEAFFARRADLNRTLATVYITHPHIDHTRGLPLVLEKFNVQHLVTNGQPRGIDGAVLESGGENQEKAEKLFAKKNALRTVARTDIESAEGVTDGNIDAVSCPEAGVDPDIRIFWGGLKQNHEGWEQKAFSNANNHSLVIRVSIDSHAVLITGDLELEAIQSLINSAGTSLNSDVLIVGHHGSHNGTSMSLVKTVSPCMAAISMGTVDRQEDWTAWMYGHPRKVSVQTVHSGLGCSRPPRDVQVALGQRRFEGFTVEHALYGTGWEGTIVFEQTERGTWKAVTER